MVHSQYPSHGPVLCLMPLLSSKVIFLRITSCVVPVRVSIRTLHYCFSNVHHPPPLFVWKMDQLTQIQICCIKVKKIIKNVPDYPTKKRIRNCFFGFLSSSLEVQRKGLRRNVHLKAFFGPLFDLQNVRLSQV